MLFAVRVLPDPGAVVLDDLAVDRRLPRHGVLVISPVDLDADSHNAPEYWQVPVSESIFGFFVPAQEASISPTITSSRAVTMKHISESSERIA